MKLKSLSLTTFSLLFSLVLFAQDMDIQAVEVPAAVIEFSETEFDFGLIDSGEKVAYVFTFTNTGAEPLIITNAKGSCGCTVPFFPKVPIMPGETSEIEVEFDSKGKKGKQSKRVSITANTEPAMTFLTIKGEVLAPALDKVDAQEDAIASQRIEAQKEMASLNPECFAIYPNPTNETLQLQLKDHIGQSAIVDIHNELGQKIMDKEIDRITSATTRFDVSDFKPGIYMITIRVDQLKPLTQCFVVTE